jgi:uncharacterized protein YndB with AHSA1/START domain
VTAPDADRDLVSTRTIDAPRDRVFEAWTRPEQLAAWWGPRGFTNTFHECDVRPGGAWRFTMHGPDGADYENESLFLEISPPERIAFRHVSPPRFEVLVTLEDLGEQTGLTWRMRFPSQAERDRILTLVTEGNEQNLDRLSAFVTTMI